MSADGRSFPVKQIRDGFLNDLAFHVLDAIEIRFRQPVQAERRVCVFLDRVLPRVVAFQVKPVELFNRKVPQPVQMVQRQGESVVSASGELIKRNRDAPDGFSLGTSVT